MLDRPTPFNARLSLAWPPVTTPDAAIERALGALDSATSPSATKPAPALDTQNPPLPGAQPGEQPGEQTPRAGDPG